MTQRVRIANDGLVFADRVAVIADRNQLVAMCASLGIQGDPYPEDCVPLLLIDPKGPSEKIVCWIHKDRIHEESC